MIRLARPFLGSLLLCIVFTAACSSSAPRPATLAAAAPADTATFADTVLCVVDPAAPAGLLNVSARRVVATGEVVLGDGERTATAASLEPPVAGSGYAAAEPWFIQQSPIRFAGEEFRTYGVERIIPAEQVRRAGDVFGVPAFVDLRDQSPPEVLYLPVAPGCIFQAYIRSDRIRQIRGE